MTTTTMNKYNNNNNNNKKQCHSRTTKRFLFVMSSLSLTILLQSSPCHAFSARLPNKAWIRRRTWIWSNDDDNNNSNNNNNNNNYDDFGDNDSIDNENNNNTEDDNVNDNDNDSDNEIINNNDDNASDSGQALAREFYKQLRQREQNAAAAKNYNDIDSFTDKYPSDSIGPKDTLSKRRSAESYPKSNNNNNNQNESQQILDTLSEQQKRELNSKPFSNRREVSAGKDVYSKNKKFTGRSSSMINNNNNPTSSAGLFSGSGQSLFAEPPSQQQQPQSPRQRMMQTEFNLATRAERSIGIQAVFALILLVFYLAVGLTGGIQNNTLYWENATDQASLDELQQLIPEPTDIEKSVWL